MEFIQKLLPDELKLQTKVTDLETVLADSLYKGYVDNHRAASDRVNHYDNLKVPSLIDFSSVSGLSNEMVERLKRANPQNFGQIRKIPGLTPAALSTVLVHLSSQSK